LIQPFILRRLKSEVLEALPPRTEILRRVELGAEEMALYEALRQQALARLAKQEGDDHQKPLQILAEIMKLRRACCHPSLVLPDTDLGGAKLAAFEDILDELLENRHKALVFSQFVDHLAILRATLERPSRHSPRHAGAEKHRLPISGWQHAGAGAQTTGGRLPGRTR